MPSLYANKFVRFERMIWPCVEFKKSFLTATRKKTFWRIFRSFRPTGWSFESYFSPRVHLEKQQLKHGDNLRGFLPRRPRGSQSGWVKRRDESFQAWGGRAPGYRLSPEYFQTVKRMLVSDKAKKKNALYYCAQSANSFSRVLFVSSYTTAIIPPQLPSSFTKLS